jgi:hypothetical protein
MTKYILILSALTFTVAACKKQSTSYSTLSSVNVVNAMVSGPVLLPSFAGTAFFDQVQPISFASNFEYDVAPGNILVNIVQAADTTQTVYNSFLTFAPNNIYCLFLTGAGSTADTVFTHDQVPQHSGTDSAIGFRFINCSPGSNSFSVNVQGSTTNLVNSLAYKQITAFQPMTISGLNPAYTLEVRDAVSDSLLYTYSGTGVLYKNQTIVIAGIDSANAAVPLTVFSVNHY